MQHVVLVHPDGPGPQGVADSDGGVEAARVDGGGETVGRGVAEADGVVFRLEFGDGADGAEDFFLHYLHVFGDAGENGRLDVVAFFAVALAADFHFGSLFLTSINVYTSASVHKNVGAEEREVLPHDTVILQLGDLRTLERVRTKWVTNNVLLRPGLESFNKLIIDTLLNINPGSGTTALAFIEENPNIFGLLPPRSKVTFFKFEPAAAFMICRPTMVDPVKATLSTSMWEEMAAPATLPKPDRILITPGGKPASLTSLAAYRALRGVCSADLRTTTLPQAMAGPIFQAHMRRGKFHGMIWPQTPI